MIEQAKPVFTKTDSEWNHQEFRLLKTGDIFSFDKHTVFTASCDAYIVQNEGFWSILVVNKDVEMFNNQRRQQRKQEKDKLFGLI